MMSQLKFLARACVLISLAMPVTAQQPPVLPPLNSPATDISSPGKFIWFDLATPAIVDQRGFYNDVFGWSYQTPVRTGDDYVLVMNRGKAIAGMFKVEPPGGEQDGATWIALMSVTDPVQALQTAKNHGGKVELEPVQVAQRGQHALIRDPEGALFGVLKSVSGDSPDQEVSIGGIIWVDLFTRDVEKMASFYSQLAPYSVTERKVVEGISGRLLSSQGAIRAGIVAVDEEANRSAWVPYVRVENVEATLAKVVEAGGFTIVAPDKVIFDGNLAVFVDPNGGVMGIIKWAYDSELSQ